MLGNVMTEITAAMVKNLREKTGAGMMDCKTALTESKGDVEVAVDWLRAKGLSRAAKKSGRITAEGLVAVAVRDGTGVVVEVNSETDFVARNEVFQDVVAQIAAVALDQDGDVENTRSAQFPGASETVGEHLTKLIGTIGENLSLRRAASLRVSPGVVATYVHATVASDKQDRGKIGVLVALKSAAPSAQLLDLGRRLAMHVAAANPLALRSADIPADIIEREKAVFAEQARESGKPENIIGKMVEGRLRKFYEESALLSQIFVIDNETRIGTLLETAGKELGAPVELTGFVRFSLGEGVEQEEKDFAAEVAAAASGS
jgi:elongation factor Ts